MIDVRDPNKQKDTKQPKIAKVNTLPTQLPARTDFNPKEPTVEDISDLQLLNSEPSTSLGIG